MKFYTNVAVQYNNVLVRGVQNGQRFQRKETFKPKLFVPKKKAGQDIYHNLFGLPLDVVEFKDIADARNFIKQYSGVSNMKIHGNTNWQYQYITENYSGEIQFDMNLIKVLAIDIETTTEYGFPNSENPLEQVIVITVKDIVSNKTISYGMLGDYTSDRPNFEYKFCNTEAELYTTFLRDWAKDPPDIITGWNVTLFDIPYLIKRMERVIGEASVKQISPWRNVTEREVRFANKIEMAIDIAGITQLDYLDLYKKFTYQAQESYKLDFIARLELGVGKLDNPYDTFKEFYTNDWQRFVEYNIVDVERVVQLEEKMRLIELALTISYDAKCCFNDVFSSVRTWDCVLYNHLWDQNVIIHPRDTTREDRTIEGAYVQEPKPGKYDWVVSFDATSLYPSIIMQYNLSPETMVRPNEEYFVQAPIDDFMDRKVDLSHLKNNNECMTGSGYHFTRSKKGLFPVIVAKLFSDRQMYKAKMIEAQKLYEETKSKKYLNDISRYTNFQMARKIQMNTLFGAWANYFFRYFDDRIAEGITLTGQYVIRSVGRALNEYLNGVCDTKDYQYSFYSDTDSCYITLDPLVNKFFKGKSKEEIVKLLDKICKDKIEPVINKACDELALYTNAYETKIKFKREVIADSGIWVAKKRYAINVYDNEGVFYNEPKLKIMGLEVVRSSTPQAIRSALKDAVKVAITKDEKELQAFILSEQEKYNKLSAEEIAFPRGVHGIKKYAGPDIYTKGTPLHVRGSLLYNHYLKEYKLTSKYEKINEGDKVKYQIGRAHV